MVFEVLSPSTEGYDRGEKFDHDQQIPTLDQYILLAADTPACNRYVGKTTAPGISKAGPASTP